MYSRYQICLSKIRLGIIPILFKCQNSCKQQFQIKYHSNETKTSFALSELQQLPSHVIWWLWWLIWKRRLNILNEVHNQLYRFSSLRDFCKLFKRYLIYQTQIIDHYHVYFLYGRISFIAMALYSNWCSHKWLIGEPIESTWIFQWNLFYSSKLFMAGGSSNGFICGGTLRKMCPKLAFHINLRRQSPH